MSYSRTLAYLAIGFFVVSLFLPSINDIWGTVTLFFGAGMLFMDPPWFIVWVGNPLFLITAWMILKDRSPVARRIIGVIGLACALYGLVAVSWVIEDTGLPQVMTIQVGFWFWLSSVAVMTLAAFAPHTVPATDTAAPPQTT